MAECAVAWCSKPAFARGYCRTHIAAVYAGRDPHQKSLFEMTPEERFWAKVDRRGPSDCWLWKASTRGKNGVRYGSMDFRGRRESAHRVAWILTYGDIPLIRGLDSHGVCVLHSCDQPLCVNPAHLSLGTHEANMVDKALRQRDTQKNKTHCKRGHPRNPANTWVDPKRGTKHCRVCSKLRMRNVYAERRIALR